MLYFIHKRMFLQFGDTFGLSRQVYWWILNMKFRATSMLRLIFYLLLIESLQCHYVTILHPLNVAKLMSFWINLYSNWYVGIGMFVLYCGWIVELSCLLSSIVWDTFYSIQVFCNSCSKSCINVLLVEEWTFEWKWKWKIFAELFQS